MSTDADSRDAGTPADFWSDGSGGWSVARLALDGDGVPSLVEMVHEGGRTLRLVPQETAARAVASMSQHPLGRMLGAMVGECVLALRDEGTARSHAERLKDARARKQGAALEFASDMARAHVERLKDAEAVERVNPLGRRVDLHQRYEGETTCFKCGTPFPWTSERCPTQKRPVQ